MKNLFLILTGIFLFASCSQEQKHEASFKKISKFERSKKYAEFRKQKTTLFGEKENGYAPNYRVDELKKAKGSSKNTKALEFVSRGPNNVGGRTRSIVIDPDDATHSTWYAASSTGGVWKTTDAGATWASLTEDWPVLPVSTLVMAGSNHDVMYAGTGESFAGSAQIAGNGIFKTADRGVNWTQLTNTINDANFKYVNRLIVDPSNPDNVLAATTKGIYKSSDGGTNWTEVMQSYVEDLDADPTDFNTLYASCNLYGVFKSTDMGATWSSSSNGLIPASRIELTVSTVNSNKLFASVNESSDASYLYVSSDKGATWNKLKETTGATNFLSQGDYDNTIVSHPYDENTVFLGGVNLWKVEMGTDISQTDEGQIIGSSSTADFITWVNFGGTGLNGGVDLGTENGATDLVNTDWSSIEIRFGPGKTQKAHRFTVPDNSGSNGDGGAGVPASSYEYKDYIDVPFEVWDVDNNRQLMVSFRDNERDGAFDLKHADPDVSATAREYFFVNAVAYDAANPDPNIAANASHVYKMLYFFWPRLEEDATWDAANLPESVVSVDYGFVNLQEGTVSVVTDAYGSGGNNYDQSAGFGQTAIPGVHPDHHELVIVPIDQATNDFMIVNGNDGGISLSDNSAELFNMKIQGYVTSQFYGIARHPSQEQYIGGMQDNGTWQSQMGDNADQFLFRIGGDGFETVWNSGNPDYLLGSVYNNSIRKSTNGGASFSYSTSGITTDDGPFITRLRNSSVRPDYVYAVSATGVYRSTNFGGSWSKKSITGEWLVPGGEAVTSSHYVQVSDVNQDIVWAGAGMTEGLSLFVSENAGTSYTAVQKPTEPINAYISGIFLHPYEVNTAYVLYSIADNSKIMKTTDRGQTWTDISGFDGSSATSTKGFPNVPVSCLLVMPQNPNQIWVGTDIGIVETLDGGTSWHLLDSELPAVAVYDMKLVQDEVVIGTHGRGIWTVKMEGMEVIPVVDDFYYDAQGVAKLEFTLGAATSGLSVFVNGEQVGATEGYDAGTFSVDVSIAESGVYEAYITATHEGYDLVSNTASFTVNLTGIYDKNLAEKLTIYPNPSRGMIYLAETNLLKGDEKITVSNLSGRVVLQGYSSELMQGLDMSSLPNGYYVVRIDSEQGVANKAIMLFK